MPIRYTPATASPGSSNAQSAPGQDKLESGVGPPRSDGISGEQKIVSVLVSRLVNKLPCNSGIRLGVMERDAGVQATVSSLLHLASNRLPLAVYALTGALEALSKHLGSSTLHDLPLEILHSQLYIIHVLNLCLTKFWQDQSLVSSPPLSELPRCWPDPHPLEDGLARYILSVVMTYMRVALAESTISFNGISTTNKDGKGTGNKPAGRQSTPSIAPPCFSPRFVQDHSYPLSSDFQSPRAVPEVLDSMTSTAITTTRNIVRLASQVIFYLSASNWSSVFSRIRTRISYFTTTIEEVPDLVDLRLLEWSNVDRVRLGQVIHEISSAFLNVKRPAQIALAIVLRKAIWTWISVHPIEYENLVESNRNIEGGPDILFDILFSLSDASSASSVLRAKSYHPLMAMLLVLCPDTLKRSTSRETSGRSGVSFTKRMTFLGNIRKGLANSKAFEGCVACYVDFMKAAMSLAPKWESSGVRSFVPDFQNDLKNCLFYSPFSAEISDPSVIVDGLVALYQNDPSDLGPIFSKIWSEPNDAQRRLAVKACIAIATDKRGLPWHASVMEMRIQAASSMRSILRAQTTRILVENTQRPKVNLNVSSSQTDLVLEILDLLGQDPTTAFAGLIDEQDGIGLLLSTISTLTVRPSPGIIRHKAARTVGLLVDHLADPASGTRTSVSLVSSAAEAVWQLLTDVSRQGLFAFHSGEPGAVDHAKDAFRIIVLSVLRLADVVPDALSNASTGSVAVLLSGVTILSWLTRPDAEQIALDSALLHALAKLTAIANRSVLSAEHDDKSSELSRRENISSQISMLEDLASLSSSIGRQQQQRQLRKVIRTFSRPSTLGISTWLGLSALARTLTSQILGSVSDPSLTPHRDHRARHSADIAGWSEDQLRTWQNLISYLCASSKACLYETISPPSLSDEVGKGVLPGVYDEETDPNTAVRFFLRENVDLLANQSIYVRESVKEALGGELPFALLQVVTTQMTKSLSHAFGPAGVSVSEPFTIFAEQAINVLRISLDRLHPGSIVGVIQVDIGDLLFTLGRYIHRLARDDFALRIKARFCSLCEASLAKQDYVLLSNNARLRNALLDWSYEWSAESLRETDDYYYAVDRESKSQRELDHACLRATVPITEGLVLRAVDDGGSEVAQESVKSRLFHRHYLHLVRVLERAHFSENDSLRTSSMNGHTPRVMTQDDTPTLATMALSNLLSANIDVGLRHCLTLGYHEDAHLRTVFMHLLANSLQQGTRFGGPTTNQVSPTSRAYLEALTSPDLAMALAVCETCPPMEVDEVSSLLFRVFEARGTLIPFLKALVEREVTQTSHETELFRANTMTTRILTNFAKTYGYNYVRDTLQPLIASLVNKPTECSFELDPSKASSVDDIERNADHLRLMCQALLDLICSSTPRVPVLFRALCHHIWEVVEDRFPDSRHSAVGSFIFLRFFCPAIVSPESIDLEISPDNRDIRRALVLITKVIQNLANNMVFGSKEPHMTVLNPFLSENIKQVTKFLSDVAVRPRSWEVLAATKVYQNDAEHSQDVEGDDAILHRFTFKHIAKLGTSLEEMPSSYYRSNVARPALTDLDGKAALQNLRRIMDESGSPADVIGLNISARSQAYDEFMKHNQGRSVESVTEAFYEGPVSQNGRRIFYFIISRVALIDYDLLAFYVFQILDGITDNFDLVIDLTGFSPATELPITWLRRSVQICPSGILPRMTTLALYNPNSYARKRMRRITSELRVIGPLFGTSVIAVSSLAELAEFIPFSSLALPEYTMSLAYEADHVFTNLLCLGEHEQHVPVVVKLGHDCLQIASMQKQDLGASLKAFIIDVIHLNDIDDIISDSGLMTDQLVIRHSQNESITFTSRKRNEMAQIIRAARARIRHEPSNERVLRPSDVPGTLLNVALLNLASSDETLRAAAYKLIHELRQFFKYELASQIFKVSTGPLIPYNSLPFVLSISKSLATSVPQLTLELLKEWTIGFAQADITQKTACLHYISPWLSNLEIFAKPSREDGKQSVKLVAEIMRSLLAVTIAERTRLYLSIMEHIWAVIGASHEAVIEIALAELLHAAINAGMGSEKAECVGDILVSLTSTTIRGKIIAKLRKTIAQTYLRPSKMLNHSNAWSEICTLSRILLALAFNPQSSRDTQLFLPDLCHTITLLLGTGPLLMRQTVYGLLMNLLLSLASSPLTGEMDGPTLQHLLMRIQEPDMVITFGLVQISGSLELVGGQQSEADASNLAYIEEMAKFLGQVIEAGAVSIECANAWRARWMGLVAGTCFQHNPAIQPQAFIVLGHLASDEVDDDIIYQILVAMITTLLNFTEQDQVLVVSMLQCLARVIPGLLPASRYAANLFWLSVSFLQLSYIPLFAASLELMLSSLRAIAAFAPPQQGLVEMLMEARKGLGDPARKLDQVCGVTFDTDPCFSLVAVIIKGIEHPSTRTLAMEVLIELLRISTARRSIEDKAPSIAPSGLAFFVALLPVVAGSSTDLKSLFAVGGMEVSETSVNDIATLPVFEVLAIPDNSTAILLITLVVTLLSTASTDAEKLILYRLLADTSIEMPEVITMAYDSLIPRITTVLATTSNPDILKFATSILQRALSDSTYSFPSSAALASESASSLNQKSYAASISSMPSLPGGSGLSAREQVLEDLGMKGLAESSFPAVRMERIGPMARWVAALIESFVI